jgi:hypothetical protein
MSSITQTTIRTLVIRAGQTAVLKKGVTILSVVKNGSVDATSTCTEVQDAIDDAESAACFKIVFLGEGDEGGGSGPFRWDNGDLKIAGISIADNFYDLGDFTLNGYFSDTQRSSAFVTKVESTIGNDSPIEPISMNNTGELGERDEFKFVFTAPASLGTSVSLKITGPAAGDPDLVTAIYYGVLCEDCCPSSH